MRKAELKLFLTDTLQRYGGEGLVAQLRERELDEYREKCRELNGVFPDAAEEAKFSAYIAGFARTQAEEIIERTVDDFIYLHYGWITLKNLAVVSVLLLPAFYSLTFYGLRHFSLLMGKIDAFADLSYENLVGTGLSLLFLFVFLAAACFNEVKKD